jgi:hypothetical protein
LLLLGFGAATSIEIIFVVFHGDSGSDCLLEQQ